MNPMQQRVGSESSPTLPEPANDILPGKALPPRLTAHFGAKPISTRVAAQWRASQGRKSLLALEIVISMAMSSALAVYAQSGSTGEEKSSVTRPAIVGVAH